MAAQTYNDGSGMSVGKFSAAVAANSQRICIQVLHNIHNEFKPDTKLAKLKTSKQQHIALGTTEHTLSPQCLIHQRIQLLSDKGTTGVIE